MSWIQTYPNNLKFDFLDPRPESISIEDIVWSLSMQPRYYGHVSTHYSIAQHCCHVHDYCEDPFRFEGLMHDACEAYVGDMVTPLKRLIPEYQAIEKRISKVIASVFGLREDLPDHVKSVDARILKNERKALLGRSPEPWAECIESLQPLPGLKIIPWTPAHTRAEFMRRFSVYKWHYTPV